jgi:serine/threonine-protein kinase
LYNLKFMPLTTRVWSAGKVLLLCGALVLTYVLFAAAAMRVAIRSREVPVPTLAGKTVNDASAALAEAGLTLKVEDGRRVDANVPAGQIVAQEPAAGARTRRQRSVRVWISAGPRSTIVPALVGESERTAQIRITQQGFGTGPAAEIRSADYAAGTVVAQSPPAKSRSDSVSLLVNHGERGATYVMPDLIGVNGDRASDLLRVRGFRVAVVGDHPYPGVPGGVVLRQRPQAGFQIAPGEPISIEVSR